MRKFYLTVTRCVVVEANRTSQYVQQNWFLSQKSPSTNPDQSRETPVTPRTGQFSGRCTTIAKLETAAYPTNPALI